MDYCDVDSILEHNIRTASTMAEEFNELMRLVHAFGATSMQHTATTGEILDVIYLRRKNSMSDEKRYWFNMYSKLHSDSKIQNVIEFLRTMHVSLLSCKNAEAPA